MVNTGTTSTSTTTPKSEVPEISVSVNTFTNLDLNSVGVSTGTSGRFATFEITITGVKTSLAYNTFSRVFNYVMELARNDMNPMTGVNTAPIFNAIGSSGTTPKGICNLQVDKSELVSTASLFLSSENLRLDYMDEFFSRTLEYLQLAISQDLNPDE